MTGMRVDGASVVVTGAGSGIGAAVARRLAAAGAHVTVNDLDAVAAQAVAADIGGLAHPGDIADQEHVRGLVEAAQARFGPVDLFCANAGVATADWDLAWRVNVLSHVHAADVLLPGWLERGTGRLVTTVSAAGILTMLGSAPYPVTKHAALAFSEWLRATYSHRGIVVQSLCPQGVRTPLLDSTGKLGEAVLGATAQSAEQVAECVLEALGSDRFLILPHPDVADFAVRRAGDPDRWLSGMNRLQQSMEQAGLL